MSQPSFRDQFGLRRMPVVALGTYGIALLAWVSVVRQWLPMPESAPGLSMSDPGAPEAMALSNGLVGVGLYLIMWGVMMIAMMYPSSVPLFRLYYNTLDGLTRAGKAGYVSVFMGTYALVWTLTMMNQFIVRPMVFFGGVFYAVRDLPSPYQELSYLNPMVYMVNGVRHGFLGVSEVNPALSLAVLSGLTAAVIALDVALFRRGYGLTE